MLLKRICRCPQFIRHRQYKIAYNQQTNDDSNVAHVWLKSRLHIDIDIEYESEMATIMQV